MVGNANTVVQTDVLVVGAGPVGLTLAITLGQYGVKTVLVERSEAVGLLPKMDLSNPRTMEIFGRLGLAEKIRMAGWPLDAQFDVLVGPSLAAPPYKVLPYPSIAEMQAQIVDAHDGSMPREPYERISQYNLEALLRRELTRLPSVTALYGRELVGFDDDGTAMVAQVKAADGVAAAIRCRYLVGCDGGNSKVRSLLEVNLSGRPAVSRMLMIFFRCPQLLENAGLKPFRHYYIAGKRHAVLIAQDDLQRWSLHVVIPVEVDAASLDPRIEIREALGLDLDVEILHCGPWTPHLLVADHYRKGNAFMVGDAVHQYIPTGGFGMNTGVSEADNLGWKLAAVFGGWGGANLLDSYHDERQPVAVRNRQAAAFAAEGVVIWRGLFDPCVMEQTPAGLERRGQLVDAIDQYQRRSHEQRGIELGYRYTGSAVCFHEAGDSPDPDSPSYVPTATPGTRLPHAWLEPGVSVHDRCGRGMSLLAIDASAGDVRHFSEQAAAKRIPLTVVEVRDRPDLRALYGASLLLLRPDLHVSWRGESIASSADAGHVLAISCGH